jgi:hypothetical protein
MDAIDRQIQELEAGWAAEEAQQKQREAEAQRAHLEKRRASLLDGSWKPWGHRCPRCLRAILTMDPSLVCEQGNQQGTHWWKRN